MSNRPPRAAGLAALLALALVAGCGATNPSSAPSGAVPSPAPVDTAAPSGGASPAPSGEPSGAIQPTPAASTAVTCSDSTAAASFSPTPISADSAAGATFAKIEAAVQQLRGITATRQIPRYTLDQASLCAFLRASFAKQDPPQYVAASERLYKLLGLLPADASLEKLYLDLLTSQVIGLYDENTKAMYVVSSTGDIGPLEQITYAHEFDHALQDQAFGINKIQGTAMDQGDRTLARHALVEGDAMLLMSLWAQKNLSVAQLGALASASDPASQAVLDATPPILKEPLLWAYTAGLQLTLGAYQTSASFAGVDALWKNPPSTTEQLLHPDKLASREPALPVDLPSGFAGQLGTGWKVSLQDTLGEYQLGTLIRTGNPKAGADPATGWGGDRVSLLEGPGGKQAVVLQTVWDDAASASAFSAAIQPLVQQLNAGGGHARAAMSGATGVTLVSAESDATLAKGASALQAAR